MTPPRPRRWHYRRSLASRVTLLTTLAVGTAIAVVAIAVYATVRVQMQATLDESLLERAELAARYPTLSELTENEQLPSWALGAADVRIIFVRAEGTARSMDAGPTIELGGPELAVARGQRSHAIRTVSAGGTQYRVAAVPAAEGEALVLAQSLSSQEKVLDKLGLVMLICGVAGVGTAAFAGWAVARNGLRPVRRLTRSVEQIARTEDLTPLQVEGDDEIARLATEFNSMLSALAASRDRQRQLVADASHELRTPITSVRTNLELLAQADAGPDGAGATGSLSAEARQELLEDVRAQIEEMSTLVGDLVELAREEVPPQAVEPVDLTDLVERAVARVRRRAPSVTLTTDLAPCTVHGEPGALERAVINLLDNAAKWSPSGGTVRVTLTDGELTVTDEGPGIAEEDLPHVFERFYRAEESRSMPGSGLGLSIVQQVAQRHSGTARARRAPGGGAELSIVLPVDVNAST